MAKDAVNDLRIRKQLADGILQASRKEDALKWLKEWQDQNGVGPGVKPLEEHIPLPYRGIIRRAVIDSMKIAHKGDHKPDFQLPDGRDYYQYPNHKEEIPVDPSGNPIPQLQNNSEEVAWVKNVGEPLTLEELIEGMKIIDTTETNPLKKRLRQDRMINNNPLANLPYQDGRAPTRPFYNAPYAKPDLFIKDKQSIDDAKKRFKLNTGIDLAKK